MNLIALPYRTTSFLLFFGFSFLLVNCSDAQGEEQETKEEIRGTEIGQLAPPLSGTSPSGKTYSTDSFKGKYVLIDFWASWCGPCRRENPNLVQAYDKYKKAKFKSGKGFDIISVSLDTDKEAWKRAIEMDELHWKAHISDLKGWESDFAKTFLIRSIPFNYLLDPDGRIVAKNLRAKDLHVALDQYVVSF